MKSSSVIFSFDFNLASSLANRGLPSRFSNRAATDSLASGLSLFLLDDPLTLFTEERGDITLIAFSDAALTSFTLDDFGVLKESSFLSLSMTAFLILFVRLEIGVMVSSFVSSSFASSVSDS